VYGLLILYGFAHIPQMYLLSYMFKISASAFAALVGLNIITSQATIIPVQVLSLPQLDLVDVSKILEWVFLIIFPNFAFR
jgi:ATP-binding cassette subfamily A (ABC1) protein 3